MITAIAVVLLVYLWVDIPAYDPWSDK